MSDNKRGPTQPDWQFWCHLPEVELWQAVALSMSLEPDRVRFSRDGWMAGPGDHGPFIEGDSFRMPEDTDLFTKRLRLLKGCLHKREHFSPCAINMSASHRSGVRLAEFAKWAEGFDLFKPLPNELVAIAKGPRPPMPRPISILREMMVAKMGEVGADAYFAEKARQQAADEAQRQRDSLAATLAELSDRPPVSAPEVKDSHGPIDLPPAPVDKRRHLLDRFRALEGKRPKEGGKKGKWGALAILQRETGIDDKNLGQMLDKAIDEERNRIIWEQLHKH